MTDDVVSFLNPGAAKVKDDGEFNKLKHIFELQITELQNIPILTKILWEIERTERATTGEKMSNKYIQNIFVKYTFPIDDEPLQSDYLSHPSDPEAAFDYKV